MALPCMLVVVRPSVADIDFAISLQRWLLITKSLLRLVKRNDCFIVSLLINCWMQHQHVFQCSRVWGCSWNHISCRVVVVVHGGAELFPARHKTILTTLANGEAAGRQWESNRRTKLCAEFYRLIFISSPIVYFHYEQICIYFFQSQTVSSDCANYFNGS